MSVRYLKDSDIDAAVLVEDFDQALAGLMTICAIADGDIASQVFSDCRPNPNTWWRQATGKARWKKLAEWACCETLAEWSLR